MPEPLEHSKSLTEAAGCGLLLMGVVGSAFGLVALLGIADVEFAFFGIDLNSPTGRLIWTAGSAVCLVAGLLLLRAHLRARKDSE